MNNTPIVMIIDAGAIRPFAVAVRSISETTRSMVNIEVVGIDIDDDQKKAVYNAVEDNVNINYVDASLYLPEIKKYAGTHEHVSNAALLKFFLPDIFKEYGKILYLDVDVIVRCDLSELLSLSVDGVYAGVVENLVKPNDVTDDIIHKRGSFNSGVMLMNCEKLRRDNICARLLETKGQMSKDTFMDQTVFNIVFKDNVRLLPLRCNYLSLFDLHGLGELNEYYGTEYESDEALGKDIAILHLAGPHKPWKYSDGYYADMWWDIYSRSAIKENIREEDLPQFRGRKVAGIFNIKYVQGIAVAGIGKMYFVARYYDGVKRKTRFFISKKPISKCALRRIE